MTWVAASSSAAIAAAAATTRTAVNRRDTARRGDLVRSPWAAARSLTAASVDAASSVAEYEPVTVSAPLLDDHNDDAIASVGQDRALHRGHLLEPAPVAVPDGLTVGFVQGEA